MSHTDQATRVAGFWLAVASALMIGTLATHGPLAPTLDEQMTRIAESATRWSIVHWTAAVALSLYAVTGLVALTSGSRLTRSRGTTTAWALLIVGALWTLMTAVAETTVIAEAAVAGATETFESWWAFAEGLGNGFAALALAVAVIAAGEARSPDGVGPAWAAWLGAVAGVSSFTGWALWSWAGIGPASLLWVVSSLLMSAWTLWFGLRLTRAEAGGAHVVEEPAPAEAGVSG